MAQEVVIRLLPTFFGGSDGNSGERGDTTLKFWVLRGHSIFYGVIVRVASWLVNLLWDATGTYGRFYDKDLSVV
jgi:hypothetical protein